LARFYLAFWLSLLELLLADSSEFELLEALSEDDDCLRAFFGSGFRSCFWGLNLLDGSG
jgi:hypothetical protein